VLWHCWLGVSNSIHPVNIVWYVGVVICLQREADCLYMVQLMPLPSRNLIISCRNSRLVLSFWYRLTQVVLEKKPFKRVSVVYCNHSSLFYYINTVARKTGPLIINRQTANKSTKHFRQDFGDAQRQDESSQATVLPVSFSALGLLGEWQEGYLVSKNQSKGSLPK